MNGRNDCCSSQPFGVNSVDTRDFFEPFPPMIDLRFSFEEIRSEKEKNVFTVGSLIFISDRCSLVYYRRVNQRYLYT